MADFIRSIISYCENNLVHFYSVPNVRNYLHHRMTFHMLGTVPYLSLRPEPLRYPFNRFIKRLFDIVVSGVFLCTLFPIIWLVVAIITKVTMPGPVFFRQKRNGLNGEEFYCYKFRSMRVNKDADRVQATKNDPRKTRWGQIMRHYNIDELPQFWNVLKGDMSIVGPRPHMLLHTEQYSKLIDKYMVRHFVKPGITGWSQVTGARGETKEVSDMERRIRGDIYYVEHWTLELDLYIMYRTVANVFIGEKEAY
jgi:putative colanic acid biosynthesis UDP-glucose lipid carrier transferase